MGAVGENDLEPVELESVPGLRRSEVAAVPWQTVILTACAVVAAAAIAVIAVMEWRQARYAREQACVQRAWTMTEFEAAFGGGDIDDRVQQVARAASCYGRTVGEARVPNVVGANVRDARERLREAGFVMNVNEGDPGSSDAIVSRQEPPAGTDAVRGTSVGVRTTR